MTVSLLSPNSKILFFTVGLFILAVLIFPSFSHGQTASPRVLLTWQAQSYVPAGYLGKALPSPNSIVTASVEIIDQGKVADLSRNNVYWYLDDSLIGSGVGKKTVNIRVGSRALQGTELMVQIPGFKGDLFFKTVVLSIVSPRAAIEAPYAGKNFSGKSLAVKGMPYFFNVPDTSTLIFNWTVNGEPAPIATSTEEKNELVVNVNPDAAPGSRLDIGLTIQNPKDRFNYGSGNVTLNLVK